MWKIKEYDLSPCQKSHQVTIEIQSWQSHQTLCVISLSLCLALTLHDEEDKSYVSPLPVI